MHHMLLVAAVLFSGPAAAETITCRISAKYGCEAAGCTEAEVSVWHVINVSDATYSRCDSSGCDKYDAQLTRSGKFFIIDVPGRGLVATLAVNMAAFVEVATVGTRALVSFGTCGDGDTTHSVRPR
jgi:hypothetical protein